MFWPIKVIISAQERTRAMAARWRFNKVWKNLKHTQQCHLHRLNVVDHHRNYPHVINKTWRKNLTHTGLCHFLSGDIEKSFVIIPNITKDIIMLMTYILLGVLSENPQDEADHHHLKTVLRAWDVTLHWHCQLDQLPVHNNVLQQISTKSALVSLCKKKRNY